MMRTVINTFLFLSMAVTMVTSGTLLCPHKSGAEKLVQKSTTAACPHHQKKAAEDSKTGEKSCAMICCLVYFDQYREIMVVVSPKKFIGILDYNFKATGPVTISSRLDRPPQLIV